MSTNFAKTLVWKQDYDVILWRHKQRTPNTNDYPMPLNETPPMKSFCVRHWARRLGNCRQTKNTTRTNLKNPTRVCAFLIKYVYLYNFIRFNDMAVIKIRTLHKWFLLTKSTSTGFSTGYKKGCSKFIVGLLRKNSVTRRGSGLTKRSNFNII